MAERDETLGDMLQAGDEAYNRVHEILRSLETETETRSFDDNNYELPPHRHAVEEKPENTSSSSSMLTELDKVETRYSLPENPMVSNLDILEFAENSVVSDGGSEFSDDHVGMAKCLFQYENDISPYGNVHTIERYYDYFALRLGAQQQTVVNNVRQTLDQQRRIEQENILRLEQEKNTWLLLGMLHSNKLAGAGDTMTDTTSVVDMTPTKAIEYLYDLNPKLQLRNVVVRWLHRTAAVETNPTSSLGRYLPCTTASLLKQKLPRTNNLVSEIDPDATLREEGKNLENDDRDDQVALLEQIWQLIRAGAFYSEVDAKCALHLMQQVERVCMEYGQPWRLASLCGGKPYDASEEGSWDGNAYRTVWKKVCLELSRKAFSVASSAQDYNDQRIAILEGTIYAVLSSDLDALLSSPLCKSWHDKCWAWFRCIVDANFDIMLIDHRLSQLDERSVHVPGPLSSSSSQEKALRNRAEKLVRYDDGAVFEEIRGELLAAKQQESYFIQIQTALIQGQFSRFLFQPGGDGEDRDFVDFLCGDSWEALPEQAIAHINGPSYVEGKLGGSVDMELLANPEVPECYTLLDNVNLVSQLLRFSAHLVLYVSCPSTRFSVVDEELPLNTSAAEAIVLTYVLFLLQDTNTRVSSGRLLLQRYEYVPLFYEQFKSTGRELCLAIQSAMMEVVSVILSSLKEDDGERARCELIEKWQAILNHRNDLSFLLLQASRQAVRNVLRQWVNKEDPPSILSGTMEEVRQEDQDFSEQRYDARGRLVSTWRWLAMFPQARTETLRLGNLIIRQLVLSLFDTPHDELSIIIAKEFLREGILPFLQMYPESPDEQLCMCKSLPLSIIESERRCWEGFFAVHDSLLSWRESMAWLVQQEFVASGSKAPPSLYKEMFSKADQIANEVHELLTGFWLVDDSRSESASSEKDERTKTVHHDVFDNDPITEQELKARQELISGLVLRKPCVLFVVFGLISVLTEAASWIGKLEDSGRKAEEEMSERECCIFLYKRLIQFSCVVSEDNVRCCFSSEEMASVLEKLRYGAMQLLRLESKIDISDA